MKTTTVNASQVAAHPDQSLAPEDYIRPPIIEEVLASIFYELARDHLPIGKLNKVLYHSLPHIKTKYTDGNLSRWAKGYARQIVTDNLLIKRNGEDQQVEDTKHSGVDKDEYYEEDSKV